MIVEILTFQYIKRLFLLFGYLRCITKLCICIDGERRANPTEVRFAPSWAAMDGGKETDVNHWEILSFVLRPLFFRVDQIVQSYIILLFDHLTKSFD